MKKQSKGNTLVFLPTVEIQRSGIRGFLTETALSFAFFAGSFCFLWSLFPTTAWLPVLLLEGLILIAWVHLCLDKEQPFLGILLPFLFLTALPLVTGSLWRNGMAVCINAVLDTWKQSFPRLMADFYVNTEKNPALSTTLFLSTFSALWAGLWTILIRRHMPVPATVAAALLLGLQCVIGSKLPLAICILLPVLLLLLAVFVWLQKDAGGSGRNPAVGGALAAAAAFCGVAVVAIWLAVPAEKYQKPELLQKAQKTIEQVVEQIRYGENKTGLPDGDFEGLAAREYPEDILLNVTMSEPASLYLKGFTGSVYTGTGFEEPETEKDYADSDLFYWLHQQKFSGLTQLAEVADTVGTTEEQAVLEIAVENENASSRYRYVPYELIQEETELTRPGDRQMLSEGIFGERSYSFEASKPQVAHYRKLSADLAERELAKDAETLAYLQKEGYYNEAVYESFLEVPEDLKHLFGLIFENEETDKGDSHKDYNEAKQLITYYLTEEMTYNEEIAPYGGEEDFIYDFLARSKTGYDVHYAATATLMFRYFGIPARYVEGYLITKEVAEQAKAGEAIALDGSSGHAWVEYYHDGIGWLPYEVTPAYMGVMEQAEEYQDISQLIAQYQQAQGEKDENDEEEATEEEEESQEETKKADALVWWEILLGVALGLIFLLVLVMILRILLERLLTRRFKQTFDDPDPTVAIRNMFTYTAAVMTAYGVPRKASPYQREEILAAGISQECAQAYREVVDIRQEAVYSTHLMTEDQRERVRRFKDRLVREVWQKSSFAERLMYRFRYFL